MKIDINENYLEQIVEVKGKTFKVVRLPKEINWNCPHCGNENCNEDDYIIDNFVECSICEEVFGIDLNDEGDILKIQCREEYENY